MTTIIMALNNQLSNAVSILSAVILSIIRLSAVMLSAIMMSVIRLSAVMLSAVMLSVIALIVRASYKLFDRSFDLTPSCPNFLFYSIF